MEFLNKISWRESLALLVVSIGLPLIALAPFLFFGRIFLNTDATYQYYGFFDFYSRALHAGDSFLWNPMLLAGFPTYLSQSAGFFDPLNILIFSIFDGLTGYHVRLLFDFALTIAASYIFGRHIGLSRTASLLIGPSFLVAFNWRFSSNVLISNTLYLFPLIFWLFLKTFQTERPRYWYSVLAGLAVGWGFIAGYAQLVIYLIFLLGIFSLTLLCFESRAHLLQKVFRYGISLLIISTLGFIAGLPQIYPALSFSDLTLRGESITYTQSMLKVVEPGDALLFAFPDYAYFPYVSSGRKPLYIGALMFLLFAVASVYVIRNIGALSVFGTRERVMLGLVMVSLFCLVASVRWSPVSWILQQLPVFELFRFPFRWMFIGAFFMSVVAAYGLDVFYGALRIKVIRRLLAGLIGLQFVFVVFIALLQVLPMVFWNRISDFSSFVFARSLDGRFGFTKGMGHYSERFTAGISAWREFTSLADGSFLAAYLLLCIALLLAMAVLYRFVGESVFRRVVPAIVGIGFIAVFAVQWPTTGVYKDLLAHGSEVMALLKAEGQGYRMYPFLIDSEYKQAVPPTFRATNDDIFALSELSFAGGWPNFNFYYGVSSIDGYDQFAPTNMVGALAQIGSIFAASEQTAQLSEQERISRLLEHVPLLSLLGVKYIVSGVELPTTDLIKRGEYVVSRFNLPLYVYENPAARPEVYLAQEVQYMSENEQLRMLSSANREGSEVTVVDCSECQKPSRAVGSMHVNSTGNGYYNVTASTSAEAWVVLSHSSVPGWVAYVDGEKVPLHRANGLFMAARVPVGNHHVIFEYRGMHNEASILELLHAYPRRASIQQIGD